MVLPKAEPTKSYWIEAAESPLRDYRSTEQLPHETDVVVIGSGYSGASAAYWLHKHTQHSAKQPQVTILEARGICSCATGRNGGQLRPHAYSRYDKWSDAFGPEGAMELIRHEMAHLPAFEELAKEEGIAEEICLKFGETFDAAMTDEAWTRLKTAYDNMRRDQGANSDVVRQCRVIEDAASAEEFTQMKGVMAAIVHPAGQVWPYKFVHALLRILLEAGNLNLQAHTPAQQISERDAAGWITVTTDRGSIRAKAVIHSTNAFASHLLPEFGKLIGPERCTLAALKAPASFIKHTGAQHWDGTVNNYHLQLPEPYNAIILGGGRQLLVHKADECFPSDDDDKQFEGMADFFRTWGTSDVKDWPGSAALSLPEDEGGCWSGIETFSADGWPFVGSLPNRDGQFIAAGFVGHGMPRILLSTAHITPLVLDSLGMEYKQPTLTAPYPALPRPFHVSAERVEKLQAFDLAVKMESFRASCKESAMKPFCLDERSRPKIQRVDSPVE
ncbi:hypothetical protein LTR62_001956 [Meristemomyces frigidus]|uniref:FAD dependent oxidoreductase domain-containing protein n=1 Tax=Meristemomyces frigidus TaxID=1508187 RepID=A0AAN7T8W2_9PEZI|nr:hypothetical protein LTR62_001956 [Meristemomyces frigidus]